MPKFRKKIFGVGTHNKIPFSLEKVKEMFEMSKKNLDGIFKHTSEWAKEGKSPLVISDSNVKLAELTPEGDVMADIEFNDIGEAYREGGVFKGISVELNPVDFTFDRVAFLKDGVKQAVAGAEFAENENEIIYGNYIEFAEEEEKVTLQEILDALGELPLEDRLAIVEAVGKSITSTQKSAFRAVQWEFAEQTEENVREFAEKSGFEFSELKEKVELTPEELIAKGRREAELEFAEKEKEKAKQLKIENDAKFKKEILENNPKISPASKQLFEFALDAVLAKEDEPIEFAEGEEKVTPKNKFMEIMKNLKGIEFAETTPDDIKKPSGNKWVEKAKEMGKRN